MSRVVVLAFLATAAAASLAPKALGQPGTPGQINDPSTYRGSMAIQQEQQRQQQEQYRQQQESQKNAPWNQPQTQQPTYGPSSGGAGPAPLRVESLPLLAAAKNPLLGRWISRAPDNPTDDALGDLGGLFGADAANIARNLTGGFIRGMCREKFGLGATVEFRPDALLQIYADGRERVVNHVSYRDHNGKVVMVPKEPGAPPFEFAFENRNRVVMDGCPLERSGTPTTVVAPRPAAPASPPSATPTTPGEGLLTVSAGATGGQQGFYGMGGVPLFIVSQNPETALAQAGFRAPPGRTTFDGWMNACHADSKACATGMRAMVASTVKNARTDATGRAQVTPLTPGRYYVVGTAATGDTGMLWHVPVDVKAGANALTLDQRNGTLLKDD
ncbi:MAG: hypothetical protein JWO33_1057 [Caulobacteraceae bacterium]|nr:hypothetical protein [Caulobacteraceae bacterium]